ncbi:MAG: rRNA pseudouridine synthase [Treponema sp.]|nr:rRNA pseudouridine synthase [Treponema sp.]
MDRIDKILAHHGFGSRKDVKKLLRAEEVSVNGNFVYDPGFQIDITKDEVIVYGEKIKLQSDLYIMMNKCQDVVCANKDGEHRTVFDLLDESLKHKFLGGDLHCMGRLDIDTEGLLILTTDGQLTHRLLSPKTHAPKTYAVGLRDSLTDEEKADYIEKFSKGFWIDREGNENGFDAQPSQLKFVEEEKINCHLTIYEGKFHQVKRMFSQLGNEVIYLKRIKMGSLPLDPKIPPGSYRELSEEEIELLKE